MIKKSQFDEKLAFLITVKYKKNFRSCTLHYQPSNFLISSDELDPVKVCFLVPN